MTDPQPARPEIPSRPAAHRSVFVKLILVMLLMALCLMGLVAGFFFVVVRPAVGETVDRVLADYARRFAADSPGPAEARALAEQLDVQVRYQGPAGAWTTDPTLPSIAEARADARLPDLGGSLGHSQHLVEAPDGGHYLLSWGFGVRTAAAHDSMVLHLLAFMVVLLFAAHALLRRGLLPLRDLQAGVARLGRGDFDVALPVRTRDEFGLLTAAFNTMAAGIRQHVLAREQLLLDVSHELRSPLTRLKLALALLPDTARKKQAEADVSEMESLVGQLLERERFRGGLGRRVQQTRLAPLLQEAARAQQGTPPGVRLQPPPPDLVLECDAEGIRTILRNLLDNALEYSPPDAAPVELSATREGDAVILRVVDSGPGVPEPDLERIFEPFFRVDRSRSRRTGGYGLGLSLCRRIAEAHGGTISVANRRHADTGGDAGGGACFTVRLPVSAG